MNILSENKRITANDVGSKGSFLFGRAKENREEDLKALTTLTQTRRDREREHLNVLNTSIQAHST